MPKEQPALPLRLPCIGAHFPCPYADKMGFERYWTCCGVRPAVKMTTLRECPRLDAVRAAQAKRNKE